MTSITGWVIPLHLDVAGTVLTICVAGTVGFYWWFGRQWLARCCNRLPNVKMVPGISYWLWLKWAYSNSSRLPPLTVLLQLVCGFCRLFDKDKIFCMWITFRPFIFFYKPETVEVLLNNLNTIDKSHEYNLLHPWLGTGLLTSSGNKWHKRRKMLTPTFHFRILEDFMPVFNEQSMILVQKMIESAKEAPFVDIVPLMTRCTLDIICETAMGTRLGAQSGSGKEYVKAVSEIGETISYRSLRPWLWMNGIFYCLPSGWKFLKNLKQVHEFTRKVIKEKKNILLREKSNQNLFVATTANPDIPATKQRRPFLELLLDHHFEDESFTEEDIREEVDTFMFEGHDTTAMALSYTLYNIGLLPEVQENVIQEIDSIFGKDIDRPVTSQDLRLMKYTECVIKESLRLYPSVPIIARELKENIQVLDYTIAPGCVCFIFPFMLHRDPEVFPDPEKFNPERFFPENCVRRHPYAYIPFSAGPRNCIGQKFALMEEKTILANIFRNMRISSVDHRDKINLIGDIILRNVEPLRLKITARSRTQNLA